MGLPSLTVQHVGGVVKSQKLVLDLSLESHVDLIRSEGFHFPVQRDDIQLVVWVPEVPVDPHGAWFLIIRIHSHLFDVQLVSVQYDKLGGVQTLELDAHLPREGEVVHVDGELEVIVAGSH